MLKEVLTRKSLKKYTFPRKVFNPTEVISSSLHLAVPIQLCQLLFSQLLNSWFLCLFSLIFFAMLIVPCYASSCISLTESLCISVLLCYLQWPKQMVIMVCLGILLQKDQQLFDGALLLKKISSVTPFILMNNFKEDMKPYFLGLVLGITVEVCNISLGTSFTSK